LAHNEQLDCLGRLVPLVCQLDSRAIRALTFVVVGKGCEPLYFGCFDGRHDGGVVDSDRRGDDVDDRIFIGFISFSDMTSFFT
jgi:hypothetical protein